MMAVGTALVWLVVMVKLPAVLRDGRNRRLLTYWLAMLFLALCLTFERAPIFLATTEITGVPNLAHGLSYGAGIISAYLSQIFVLYSISHDRLRRESLPRAAVLAVGLILYSTFFVLGPARLPTDPSVSHLAATSAPEAAFRLTLAVLTCWPAAEVAWLAWRLSLLTAQKALRTGLRLVTLGAMLIFLRVSIEYAVFPLWSAASGWSQSLSYSGSLYALNVVAMTGAVLLAVGTTLPALVRRRQARLAVARHRNAQTVLAPLWEEMRSVTAVLSTAKPTSARRRIAGGASPLDAMYRMVAEIRDGIVVLRPYRQLEVEARLRTHGVASGLSGEDLEAYVEAGSLRHAVAARAAGQGPRPLDDRIRVAGASVQAESLDGELHHLLKVAHWWGRGCDLAAPAARPAAPTQPAARTGRVSVEG